MPDVKLPVVPFTEFGVVPPIAGGLLKSNVPPRAKLPLDVIVPVKVNPLTVPVPDTDVTVPTLTLPPKLVADPLMLIELLASCAFVTVPLNAVVGMVVEAVMTDVPLP